MRRTRGGRPAVPSQAERAATRPVGSKHEAEKMPVWQLRGYFKAWESRLDRVFLFIGSSKITWRKVWRGASI